MRSKLEELLNRESKLADPEFHRRVIGAQLTLRSIDAFRTVVVRQEAMRTALSNPRLLEWAIKREESAANALRELHELVEEMCSKSQASPKSSGDESWRTPDMMERVRRAARGGRRAGPPDVVASPESPPTEK